MPERDYDPRQPDRAYRPRDWDASRSMAGWNPERPGPRDYRDDFRDNANGLSEGDRWRGRFFGRGPKGYRRSDERIRDEISDRLMAHPDVDASDMEISVANGIVTLAGTVEDRHEKRIAEYIAEDTLGVDDVNNELKVRHGFWASIRGEKATEKEVDRRPDTEVAKPSAEGGRANAARNAARRDSEAR